MNDDIRWRQRFQNFEKAMANLTEGINISSPSKIEKAGIIQIYEFTFELAWKTIKDYLEGKEVDVKFPKDTIKEGFKYELITDGDTWMDMLQKRNLMAHTYDEKNAEIAYNLIIENYFQALKQVQEKLLSLL